MSKDKYCYFQLLKGHFGLHFLLYVFLGWSYPEEQWSKITIQLVSTAEKDIAEGREKRVLVSQSSLVFCSHVFYP